MPWWRENSNYCFLWHNEFWVVRIVPTFLFIQLLNMHSSFLLVPTYMIDNKHDDRHVHIPWYSVELIQCSTVNISDAFNEDSDYFFFTNKRKRFFSCVRGMHARTLAFTVRDFLRFLCKWVKYCVVWNDFLWINHVNTYYPFLHLLCQPIPRFCNFNLLLFGIVYIDIPPLKNVINQRMRVVKLFWVIRNLVISFKKYGI